jgi:hypothetical protein
MAVATAGFRVAASRFRIPGAAELLARALTLVPDDSHEAGRLLSHYGGIVGVDEGDYEDSQQALGRALSIARREGDVALEVQTLGFAATVSAAHLHWQESADHGLRAIELATYEETLSSSRESRWWTSTSLLRIGEPDAARHHALFLVNVPDGRTSDCLPLVFASFLSRSCRALRATGRRAANIAAGAWRLRL